MKYLIVLFFLSSACGSSVSKRVHRTDSVTVEFMNGNSLNVTIARRVIVDSSKITMDSVTLKGKRENYTDTLYYISFPVDTVRDAKGKPIVDSLSKKALYRYVDYRFDKRLIFDFNKRITY